MDELPEEVPTQPLDVKATDTLTLFNNNGGCKGFDGSCCRGVGRGT